MLIHRVVDIVLLSLGFAVCAIYRITDKVARGNPYARCARFKFVSDRSRMKEGTR